MMLTRILPPLFALFFFIQGLNAQIDTLPPVLICKTQVAFVINPTCYATVLAESFIDTVYDDTQLLELAIRKKCVGSGFPSTSYISFGANELGSQVVEIWARDNTGNTTSCIVNINVGDYVGNCDPSLTIYFGTVSQSGIDSVFADIRGTNCELDSFNYSIFASIPDWIPTILQGYYSAFSSISPAAGYDVEIIPYKNDNPLNGITEEDLILITAYILGEVADSPYKLIAADANQDGKINILDIIVLRKLMLGISDELHNGKSWRFLPDDFVISNPQNPFSVAFPEKISISNMEDPVPSTFYFTGLKIGDVNFSADPN